MDLTFLIENCDGSEEQLEATRRAIELGQWKQVKIMS
jgi:hypothetical protein